MSNHIHELYGFDTSNAHIYLQIETCYIKSSMSKHISPNFFYHHELYNKGEENRVS
jgi:hypothetical protein